MGNGVTFDGDYGARVRRLEIDVTRNTARLDSLQREVTEFKDDMQSDIKEIKNGQRTTILALLGVMVTLATASVPLIILVASRGGP